MDHDGEYVGSLLMMIPFVVGSEVDVICVGASVDDVIFPCGLDVGAVS